MRVADAGSASAAAHHGISDQAPMSNSAVSRNTLSPGTRTAIALAQAMAFAAAVMRSHTDGPPLSGGSPGSPVASIRPASPCTTVSNARLSRSTPLSPKPLAAQKMIDGLAARQASKPMPHLSIVPLAKFSMTTSLVRTRSRNTRRPSGACTCSTTLDLL